jgi:hypothetical protein
MSGPVIAVPVVPRRTYTLTAHLVVNCEADLRDPFTRFAVFRAVAEALEAAPLVVDTPYGAVSGHIGLVTAVS